VLPISKGIAEPTVNPTANQRLAKTRQMRWSNEGAHCLALIRVASRDSGLSPSTMAALRKAEYGSSRLRRADERTAA
jgi:hypothetical protein